jgi:hypothetical protein
MNISLYSRVSAAVLAAFAFAVSAAAQEPAAEMQAEITVVKGLVDSFFKSLTNKAIGGDGAVRGIIGNSPLKNRTDDINKLIEQAASLDRNYGAYTGHEEASVRVVGKDLIFLRYLYKGERFPVVWHFTFYRPGSNGTRSREWTLIGLKFDSKVEVLDR